MKVADVIDLLVEALALEKAGAKGLDEFWDAAQHRSFEFEPEVHVIVEELFNSLLAARGELGRST